MKQIINGATSIHLLIEISVHAYVVMSVQNFHAAVKTIVVGINVIKYFAICSINIFGSVLNKKFFIVSMPFFFQFYLSNEPLSFSSSST